MKESTVFFTRSGRTGTVDVLLRSPELHPLRNRTVAAFGAGCLGAPSILEFARAGISEMRIMDGDHVDPGATGRWPLGLSAGGHLKVTALADFIARNYPSTKVIPVIHRLGMVQDGKFRGRSDWGAVEETIAGVSLIYDATAEIGVQHFLSEVARTRGIPYLAVTGTYGGWGGKIISVVPGRTRGCWMCARWAFDDETIPEPPSNPVGEVQGRGCGDVTFTAADFDMGQIALTGVQKAVSTLCADVDDAYPNSNWDVLTIAIRDGEGNLTAPRFSEFILEKHSKCANCNV